MRKAIWLATIALLLVGLLLLAGCGGGAEKAGENTSSKSLSIETSSAAEGVLIYPGATRVDTGDMSGMMRGPGPGEPDSQGSRPSGSTPGFTDSNNQDSSATGQPPQNGQMIPPQGTESGSAPTPPTRIREMPVAYRTSDSVDKVVAWYKEKLSGKTGFQQMTMPSRGGTAGQTTDEGAAFSFKSGDTTKMVMIRKDTSSETGGTLIMISNAPEGMPSAPQTNQQ